MEISKVGIYILQKAQHELLAINANQLLEKEHSGCHALLRDDKVGTFSPLIFGAFMLSIICNDYRISCVIT